MRMFVLSCALLFVPLPAIAQSTQDCSGLRSLAALYTVRDAMIRTGETSSTVTRAIDDQLHLLRDPLNDGTYRWVRLARPAGANGPTTRREKIVHAVRSNDEVDTFEARGSIPYAISVVVPRKRSLLRGNNAVWIGEVRLEVEADGERDSITHTINEWFRPDTSRTIDLGMIADVATVQVQASTDRDSAGAALVEVHFREAVSEDDPLNPEIDGVMALTRIRERADVESVDHEIAVLERSVLGMPVSTPFGTLMKHLIEAEKLLESEKEEDRARGLKMLKDAVDDLEQ